MISPDLLRRFSLFTGLAPLALSELAQICGIVMVEQGQWLFIEGDVADALYLIITGSVSLTFILGDQRASYTTLSRRYEGDALGWSALVKPHFYKFGALVTEDTQLARFDGQRLLEFLKKNPDYGYTVMQAITEIAAQRLMSFRAKLENLEERQFLLFDEIH